MKMLSRTMASKGAFATKPFSQSTTKLFRKIGLESAPFSPTSSRTASDRFLKMLFVMTGELSPGNHWLLGKTVHPQFTFRSDAFRVIDRPTFVFSKRHPRILMSR